MPKIIKDGVVYAESINFEKTPASKVIYNPENGLRSGNAQDAISEVQTTANKNTLRIIQLENAKDTLTERMNMFTNLKEGSTTGDAELADIRVKYDGKVSDSAGDAVREQISNLRLDIDNFIDEGLRIVRGSNYNAYWNSNKELCASTTANLKVIQLDSGVSYTIHWNNGNMRWIGFSNNAYTVGMALTEIKTLDESINEYNFVNTKDYKYIYLYYTEKYEGTDGDVYLIKRQQTYKIENKKRYAKYPYKNEIAFENVYIDDDIFDADRNRLYVQGGCTDGTYYYYSKILQDETRNSELIKIDLATMQVVNRNTTHCYGHISAICYNEKLNKLVLLGFQNPSIFYIVNPDTLEFESSFTSKVSHMYGSMAYNKNTGGYFVEQNKSSRNYVIIELDSEFNEIKSWIPVNSDKQAGFACDGNFLYALYFSNNRIIVYNLDGEYVGYHNISVKEESKSIAVVNNILYTMYSNTETKGAKLYSSNLIFEWD